MTAPSNTLIPDGNQNFIGGQNASQTPDKVAPDSYYSGINVSTERGSLTPRWGFKKLKLNFLEGGITTSYLTVRSYKDIFETGKFQALIPYSNGSENYLIIVISGVIFFLNLRTNDVQILEIGDGTRLDGTTSRINWTVAAQYIVLFDFPAFPVIIDGGTARRADISKDEIPVSNIGTYNQNRLFIGNAGNEFTAGDPVGSLATPNAPLTFTEVLVPGASYFNQSFQLNTGYSNDPITFMGFLQVVDTSTGIGPLLVASKNAVYSYNTQNPRAAWEAGQFGSLVMYNAGIAGPRAGTNVNSDFVMLSGDGQVRSLSMSREEQHKWSKVPLSREVQNWLKFTDKDLAKYSFVTYFRNKILIGANPYRVQALTIDKKPIVDYAHGGFIVLELDNVSGFNKESNPVWAGLWTGVRPMDIAVSGDASYVISKDNSTINQLYLITPDTRYDEAEGQIRMVRSKIYTRQYDFSDPFANKELKSLDLGLINIKGDFSCEVKYKPAQAPSYIHWRTFTHKAPWRECNYPVLAPFQGFAGHQFLRINLGSPLDESCNPITQELYSWFRRVQLSLTLQGIFWELQGFKLVTHLKAQAENEVDCMEFPIVPMMMECNDDWSFGGFTGCHTQTVT